MSMLRNRYFFLTDVLLLPLAVYIAFVLRLERLELREFWPAYFILAFTTLLVVPIAFWYTGLYSRYWRYASAEELLLLTGVVVGAVLLISAIGFAIVWLLPGVQAFARSLPFILVPMVLIVTAGPRYLARLAQIQRQRQGPHHPSKRVVIFGAGDAGQSLARDIRYQRASGLELVGFLDDDPRKRGLNTGGVVVLGHRDDIPAVVDKLKVQQIIIAMPSAPGGAVREIVDICKRAQVSVAILPELITLLDSSINVRQLRPVEIEDLLRRKPIRSDLAAVHSLIAGKIVLVTGAGGSIGSELCRQIARARPASLLLLGHGENSIFDIYNELQSDTSGQPFSGELVPLIADIRDRARLEHIFNNYRPDIVFHAAAHKHVPLMESNAADAITNNVLGTHNLLEASLAHSVAHFVLISTDKAVNPASIMGLTKRVAEILVIGAARRSGQAFVTVRFGNVLGSRGSVIPVLKQQIARGGPVTITHPDVTRYFMTIPEAVQLVLQAATLGGGGELFMLDMGEPVRILDLANDLIRLSGLRPGEDIEIVFTGLRPGEKLREELVQDHESYVRTPHEAILRVSTNTAAGLDRDDLPHLAALIEAGQTEAALALLASFVPEFQPNEPPDFAPLPMPDEIEVVGAPAP